ncbi:MAG: hypothetical protein FH751_17340 [Firmicutes bacterium]|nr:hypothetical protein [Bacillota bacterium]
MRKVIREVETKNIRPLWQVSLMFLLSVVFINFLITLSNKLGKYNDFASFIILTLSLIALIILIKKVLCNYVYTLDDEQLVFKKGIGKKSKLILDLNLNEIDFIRPIKEVKKDKGVSHTYKLMCNKNNKKLYVGQFIRDGKKYRFVFKPSENLIKSIDTYKNSQTVHI